MDGDRLLVDTNIILYALKGDKALTELIDGRDLYISFITRIELLSFPKIDKEGILSGAPRTRCSPEEVRLHKYSK